MCWSPFKDFMSGISLGIFSWCHWILLILSFSLHPRLKNKTKQKTPERMRRGKCQWPPYIKPFLFLRYASSSSVVYFIHSSTSLDVTTCRYKWWKWAFSKGCLAFRHRVRSSAKWEGLSIEPLLPHMEMSQFGHLAKMPPMWGVFGDVPLDENRGHAGEIISLTGLGLPLCSAVEAGGGGWGERSLGILA